MDPETDRLINLLKVCLKILGITNREVARRLEMSPSYISKLLSGASELRLDHVIRICHAAGVEPSEFFSLAYPRQTTGSGSLAASRLRDLLQTVQPPPPPAKPTFTEEQIQEMLKATLERMLDRRTG
ncbi:MAG: Cro/C1-type DNA-binding domain [Acidobacteriota bacterium]|jgi:transcriptional regulator with XRE-family HTH domain|nr:Cro/C1-type DNA-binding domain [Acidobacteriota bacterium]